MPNLGLTSLLSFVIVPAAYSCTINLERSLAQMGNTLMTIYIVPSGFGKAVVCAYVPCLLDIT